MQRRPPARCAVLLTVTDERQGHGLRMPSSNEREVRSTSRPTSPSALTFEKGLPISKLTGQLQVSVATWTAQLYTQASGHPLPVSGCARGRSVRRSDRVPDGGRAGTGGTSGAELPEGETREWSRTVRTRLTGWLLMLRDEGGGGVPLRRGRWQLSGGRRSQISASIHQSRERRWAGKKKSGQN